MRIAGIVVLALALTVPALAAGTLTPVGSGHQPVRIESHDVRVVINNGFAQTVVEQSFFNPNPVDLEAIYAFPIPKSASLSEMTIVSGELTLDGEVLPKDEARRVYEEERDAGNDAGMASKDGIQSFEFRVSPVRADDRVQVRFVYYQPLAIDSGFGRYLYPLEEGGTDDAARSFWTREPAVDGRFSFELELKSAVPVSEVRLAGLSAQSERLGEGHHRVRFETQGGALDRDIVFNYRLADSLPGRLEVIPFRDDVAEPGTFMMVLTPGVDLQPITQGVDYSFILDISGSMSGKVRTLAESVSRALGELDPDDRFRIVLFSNSARSLTRGWVPATQDNVDETIRMLGGLRTAGGTNMYSGLELGLKSLDDDRPTSVILVTDAVTNQGVLEPARFHELMKRSDVRIFGFLLGNSSNWPLMQVVCEASGGYWTQVSNADDILGQIMLAKEKIGYEALHDVELSVSGVEVTEASIGALGKIYRGEQIVAFGRYTAPGRAKVTLDAKLTGNDESYSTIVDFPEIDTDHPELERLWALHRIEAHERQARIGALPESELAAITRQLGVDYQLVTDETSMVVLTDEAFLSRGIERRNRERVARERQAQAQRKVRSYRADAQQPMFPGNAPRPGSGAGAIDPISALLALALGGGALAARRRR